MVENKEEGLEHKTGSYQDSLNRDQATGSFWVSKELLDLIEAVPFHEQFISSFEETMLYHLESLELLSSTCWSVIGRLIQGGSYFVFFFSFLLVRVYKGVDIIY